MTTTFITREQTDHAISEARGHIRRYVAQLSQISTTHTQDQLTEITTQTVREVLFSALQHAPIKEIGHAYADTTLRQAASIAALKAREAVHPAVFCNITASRLHRHITESTADWLHRNAPVLQAAGQGIRDVYQALLMACTDALQYHQDTKPARQQAVDLAAHIRTVFDIVTNVEAVRERMPTPSNDYSPFPTKQQADKK